MNKAMSGSDRGPLRHVYRLLARIFAIFCVVLVAYPLGGCIESKDPLIRPQDADYPFGDYTHFMKYQFDQISNNWTGSSEGAVRRNKDGGYDFFMRDDSGNVRQYSFLLKQIAGSANRGKIYIAQVNGMFYFSVIVSEHDEMIDVSKRTVIVVALDPDCASLGWKTDGSNCIAPSWEALAKAAGGMTFETGRSIFRWVEG